MRHEIEAYFEPDMVWLGEINRRLLQLEGEVGVLPAQQTSLHCALWRGREARAGLTLTLRVGDVELCSRAEDASPVAATRRAFGELQHQLSACMKKLRDEGFWSRTSRNRGALETRSGVEPGTRREATEAVDHHLTELYNFVRRELASRQVTGGLSAGDLTPEEVLDDAALTALERFDERPAGLDFQTWLFQLALDCVERRAREIRAGRESLLRLEGTAHFSTSAAARAAEDEIFEFYQPAEEMRLEDLIADERVPTPEEALARREFQRHINRTLASLPRRWREAFVLYSVEGLNLEEVARVLRLPVDSARRFIELAREYLRECLVEAGVTQAAGESLGEEVKAL
jgi:RNA polymerase sigma factor (sigma-70 family)